MPVSSSPTRRLGQHGCMSLQAMKQREHIPTEKIQHRILILLGDFWPMCIVRMARLTRRRGSEIWLLKGFTHHCTLEKGVSS